MAEGSPNSTRDLKIELDDIYEEDNDSIKQETQNDQEHDNPLINIEEEQTKHTDSPSARGDPGKESDDASDNQDGRRGNRSSGKLNVCTSSSETKSVRSRVFVGHLNTDKITRRDMEKLFAKCGKVEAVSLLNGYGFVQFDNEETALKAIEKYHGTSFFGIRLVVDKPAAWKRLDGETVENQKPWPRDGKKDRSPREDRHAPRYDRQRGGRSRSDSYNDDAIPSRYRDPEYERYLEMRYMEDRLADRYRSYDRLYSERYPPLPRYHDDYLSYRGGDRHEYPSRGYEYNRDDDYDRERRPFDYSYH